MIDELIFYPNHIHSVSFPAAVTEGVHHVLVAGIGFSSTMGIVYYIPASGGMTVGKKIIMTVGRYPLHTDSVKHAGDLPAVIHNGKNKDI